MSNKLGFIGEFEKVSLPLLRVVEDVDPYGLGTRFCQFVAVLLNLRLLINKKVITIIVGVGVPDDQSKQCPNHT